MVALNIFSFWCLWFKCVFFYCVWVSSGNLFFSYFFILGGKTEWRRGGFDFQDSLRLFGRMCWWYLKSSEIKSEGSRTQRKVHRIGEKTSLLIPVPPTGDFWWFFNRYWLPNTTCWGSAASPLCRLDLLRLDLSTGENSSHLALGKASLKHWSRGC